jgi:two-component system phosphate regulon response regulator OmpR
VTGRILIIDDDVRLADMVSTYLGQAGFQVEARHTGQAGVDAAAARTPDGSAFDAVILDIMLPDLDGLEVCRRLRAAADVAILMLSARGEDTDRIVGLELLARLKAVLRRRPAGSPEGLLRFGRLEIEPGSRAVRVGEQDVTLTSYQFDLLHALARHAGKVMSRERLLDLVKGEELEAFDRSIDVHVSRIRAAIEDDPARPRRILTVRGSGYLFARNQDQG